MPNDNSNNISEARRRYERMTGTKFTQEDAAKQFGVSLSAYRNYEQEKNLPKAKTLNDMADFYHVSSDYLLGKVSYAVISLDETKSTVDVSDDEVKLIKYFRMLPEDGKQAVLSGLKEFAHRKGADNGIV
ncbi:MAG: helix-turn-helix domain-containing protein [Eggerthellaceae bacterium]|nr:helix-turn-helix domain-containing protein [Eggerthellaceae bacterium]